jgi:hypothetical protein
MALDGRVREQDVFDDVLSLDDALVQRGYDEGIRVGNKQGDADGAQLGRLKGAEVAVRVAVYRGRLDALRILSSKHPSVFPKR